MNFKGFSIPTKVPRKLVDSELRDESTKDDVVELDLITEVTKKGIEGTIKKKEKKELVIPLIVNNVWREGTKEGILKAIPKEIKTTKPKEQIPDSTGTVTDELERQAVREILESANLELDKSTKEIAEIPLLLQNRIPTGYEEDDNMDVSLRPEQSTLQDYEQVPIEEYGMAMLRGMGWNKKEGIGLRNKGHVEIKEPQLRPKGLGLGAERPQTNKDIVSQAAANAKDGKVSQCVKLGGYALITKGSDKGLYGKIESFDEDNNRIHLKLSISARMVAVSKFNVSIVSDSEYKQKSKVLNNDKYEKYKLKSDERLERHGKEGEDREDRGGDSSETDSHRIERRKESRSRRRDSPESKTKKRKHEEEKSHRSERKKDKRRRDSPGSKKSRRHRDEKSYRRSP